MIYTIAANWFAVYVHIKKWNYLTGQSKNIWDGHQRSCKWFHIVIRLIHFWERW